MTVSVHVQTGGMLDIIIEGHGDDSHVAALDDRTANHRVELSDPAALCSVLLNELVRYGPITPDLRKAVANAAERLACLDRWGL